MSNKEVNTVTRVTIPDAASVVKGSSVLLNLLLSGEDRVNGYTIPNTPPLHTVLQQVCSYSPLVLYQW